MAEKLIRRYSKNMKMTEKGNHIRLRIRAPGDFIKSSFRTDDVGRTGFSKRIGGRLKSTGKWATQVWIFSKKDFGREGAIREAEMYAKSYMRR